MITKILYILTKFYCIFTHFDFFGVLYIRTQNFKQLILSWEEVIWKK